LTQIRHRNVQVAHGRRQGGQISRGLSALGGAARAFEDGLHLPAGGATAALDDLLHALQRMLGQQLQDAHELTGARAGAVLPFQVRTQLPKQRRQLPIAVNPGMVECGRPAPQAGEVVQRIEHLLARGIRASMPRDHLVGGHHGHGIDVALDGHRLKGPRARHAVGVAVETHRLIFVHPRRLLDAGIENTRW
jgi:hypothetical protein